MSDLASCWHQLKSVFLDNPADADTLLRLREQLKKLEETTEDAIVIGLVTALKRHTLKKQWDNSKHVIET